MSPYTARLHSATFLILLAAAFVATGARVPAGAESRQLTSEWRDRDIRIDGIDEEWRGLTRPVKGHHFAVGFVNDADALYFCLVTKDETTLRQISRLGLILWIDPPAGKKHTFGVRFPVTYGPGRPGRPAGRTTDRADDAPRGEVDAAGFGQREIEILGPGRNDVRSIENGSTGVVARFTVKDDLVVYELKVPLAKGEGAPFAPGAQAGSVVRIGLQTPEWRGPLPGRRGGIGIGACTRGGGIFYPGADMAMLKPLDISAELKLASR